MTGAEFAAAGHALALAYAGLRPEGAAWLAAWQAEDRTAADELMNWELEGHPFTDLPIKIGAETMTVADALAAMLALYATPGTWSRHGTGEDGTWDLEAALYRVVGDPDEEGITEAEWRRREALVSEVSEACGVYLAEFNDTVRRQDVVVSVLQAGWARKRF